MRTIPYEVIIGKTYDAHLAKSILNSFQEI
jgi:hypothetical protein